MTRSSDTLGFKSLGTQPCGFEVSGRKNLWLTSACPQSRHIAEEDFRVSKGLAGLDQHQVCRWTSWYRRTTLAMLAAAFLIITAAAGNASRPAIRFR
jgi:hypothetical protein